MRLTTEERDVILQFHWDISTVYAYYRESGQTFKGIHFHRNTLNDHFVVLIDNVEVYNTEYYRWNTEVVSPECKQKIIKLITDEANRIDELKRLHIEKRLQEDKFTISNWCKSQSTVNAKRASIIKWLLS